MIKQAKGCILKSGSESEPELSIIYRCPDCQSELKETFYSVKDKLTHTRKDGYLKNFGVCSGGCTKCGGWILIKFVNDFPTDDEISNGAEVDIVIHGPAPSP